MYRIIGLPPVAAAEPARLRSTAQRALLLSSQEVLRTYRSLRQRLHRLRAPNYRVTPCSCCRAPRGCDRLRSGRCSWVRQRSCGPIAACGSGYTDCVHRTIGVPPVAAAEHREAAIDREAGAALGCARGPATSVAQTIAACGSGYTDRVYRTIGLPPCSRCRAPRGCDRPRSGRCSWTRRRSCDQRGPDHRSLRQRLHRLCDRATGGVGAKKSAPCGTLKIHLFPKEHSKKRFRDECARGGSASAGGCACLGPWGSVGGGVGCVVVVLFAVVLLLAEPELFQGMPGAFAAVIAGERAGLARRSQVGRLQDMISRKWLAASEALSARAWGQVYEGQPDEKVRAILQF